MKKIWDIVLPVKSFAALMFTGMICLYMVAGLLCDVIKHEHFNYSIPFVFVLLWLFLSVMISILSGIFCSEKVTKKWRCCPRLIVFAFSLMVLLAACLFALLGIPWAKLWLLAAGCAAAGAVVLSIYKERSVKNNREHPCKS